MKVGIKKVLPHTEHGLSVSSPTFILDKMDKCVQLTSSAVERFTVVPYTA